MAKWANICVIGTPEGKENQKEAEIILKGIMTYNSSKLMK